jgi:sugar phosphate isomerase/epimerase
VTTRRDVLMAMAAAGVGALLPRVLRADPLTGVGIQLYTLRNEMQRDPLRTLERIAQIGYTEIEWWGEFGQTPAQLRSRLDANGLSSPAWHLAPEALAPEQLGATLDTAAIMGHKHLIIAWLPPAQRTQDGFKRIADLLNAAGERAASVGVRTGYHNHDFEFARADSGTLWDVLVGQTDARFVDLELDCYWAFKAGHDPIALLRHLKDRITHLHLKDSTTAPAFTQKDLGEGVIDWPTLLRVAAAGRVQHVFVEHDAPVDPWVTAEVGRRYLRGLGY